MRVGLGFLRSTAKLSKYMTPDAIAQLQMQEQQRAHEVHSKSQIPNPQSPAESPIASLLAQKTFKKTGGL